MKKGIFIGCMILGLLAFLGSAEARYDYEVAYGYSGRDSEFRNAVAMDDWLERGRAAVIESPLFPVGVRLTAEGGEGAGEAGLASAIYYFTIPPKAQYLTIRVRYNDTAQDDQIAGRLWIKSSDTAMQGEVGAGQEAPLYGDTFVLRSERSSESITVPAGRHVEGGTVELHIVVQGTDCIDVRDIQVEYLYTRPAITVVHRTCNDYWDRWPRHRYAYDYFYWGPLFWPRTYIVYECWDVPVRFYWASWRPWFFLNIICVHHHRPWWGPRRYTVVYHVDRKHPVHKRRHLLRKRLKERRPHVTRRIFYPHPAVPKKGHAPFTKAQEVRLNKKIKKPHTPEPRIKPYPIRRPLKEQPVQVKERRKKLPHATPKVAPSPVRKHNDKPLVQGPKQREKPSVKQRTKAVDTPPVVNKPNSRSARPINTAPKRIQKEQSRSRSVPRESLRGPAKARAGRGYSPQ